MVRMIWHWLLNAVALILVAHFVQGFVIANWISALIAVVVIGLFNATFGLLLKIITLPLGILSFGIFFLVINAFILKFSSNFVPGFEVQTFKAAFLGALSLAVLHLLFGFLKPAPQTRRMKAFRAIAAIRSGTDPVARLPEAAFHRTLEEHLGCPKCDVIYTLIAEWEWATSRHFDDESRSMIRMLKKAIQMAHGTGHRVTHYETAGVTVQSFVPDPTQRPKRLN